MPGLAAVSRSPVNAAESCRKQAFRRASSKAAGALAPSAAAEEASRCLQCDRYCGICVSVCPNRANLAVFGPERSWPAQEAVRAGENTHVRTLGVMTLRQSCQVLNIGDFCNECGNCEAFCPSADAPYKVKQRVHFSDASFTAYKNGIMALDDGGFVGKRDGAPWSLRREAEGWLYEDERLTALLDAETLAARRAELKKGAQYANLGDVAQIIIFCDLVRGALPRKA